MTNPQDALIASGGSASGVAQRIRWRAILESRAAAWIVPLAIVLSWQLVCVMELTPSTLLPSPAAVIDAAWRLTLTGELPRNLGVSFLRAIGGLAIGGRSASFSAWRTASPRSARSSPTRPCRWRATFRISR